MDYINEITSEEAGTKSLTVELLDPDLLIKKNDLKEISNPIYFSRNNVPTIDGLLSNEIFGIVKADRANIFAYVNLINNFMHPLAYKIWCRMDSKIRDIVHGTKYFIINADGDLIEDEKGETGLKFLKKNIEKINIKSTDSIKRDRNIQFLNENRSKLFLSKWIIIPAFYRDVNNDAGYIGIADINKLYGSLIMSTKSIKETKDYGFDTSEMVNGRIQEIILIIYDWFAKEPNLSKKQGIIRRANLTKTDDYASRLVISAPNLKVEKPEELMVNLDYSALPLPSACVNFFPYMIFYIRRFFENEFIGNTKYKIINSSGKEIELNLDDPMLEFSDDRIKKEINRFIRGFSNRFIPIKVPVKEDKTVYMRFKGRIFNGDFVNNSIEDINNSSVSLQRNLTWCDIFYMAAIEVSKDKHIMITRYPIDSPQNQFPTKIVISSTKETEVMIMNNEVYNHYPKIRQEQISKNTSNKFIDTLQISNNFLNSIGGDYDGDQTSVKGIYTIEANEELDKFMNSKGRYISINGQNMMYTSKETIQSIYSLTKISSESKLINPVF